MYNMLNMVRQIGTLVTQSESVLQLKYAKYY
jgi:hypothetical protein